MFNSLPGNISSHTRARGGSSNLSNSPTLENPSLPPSHENWSIGTAFDFAKPVSPSPIRLQFRRNSPVSLPDRGTDPPKMLPYPCLCVCSRGCTVTGSFLAGRCMRACFAKTTVRRQPASSRNTHPTQHTHTHTHTHIHIEVACALPHHVLCGSVPFFGNGTPVERESFPFRRCPLSSSPLSSLLSPLHYLYSRHASFSLFLLSLSLSIHVLSFSISLWFFESFVSLCSLSSNLFATNFLSNILSWSIKADKRGETRTIRLLVKTADCRETGRIDGCNFDRVRGGGRGVVGVIGCRTNRGSRWEEGKLNEVASNVEGDVIIKRYRAARGN